MTYLTVLQIFGSQVAGAFAWVNALAAIASLCTVAVLYLENQVRIYFITSLGKYIPPAILIGGLIVAEISGMQQYLSSTLTAALLCRISFSAIQRESENRTLLSATLSAVLMPLSVLPSLIEETPDWIIATLIIPIILIIFHVLLFKTRVTNRSVIPDDPRSVVSAPLTSLLAQLPLILFPIIEPKVIALSDPARAAEFQMTWKFVYGLSVVIYSKVQFKIAFSNLTSYQHVIHKRFAMLLFGLVLILTLTDTGGSQVARVLLTAIFINEVSILVRNQLRVSGNFLSSLFSSLLFASVVSLFFLDVTEYAQWLINDTDIIRYYPALICVVSGTCLVSLFPIRKAFFRKR